MSFIYKQERSQEDSWGTQNTVHLTQLIIIIIIIRQKHAYHFNTCISMNTQNKKYNTVDVDVDVVDLRAQADASMPASNNNVIIIQYI